MAGKRRILAVNALFFSLGALAATFQFCGFLLSLLNDAKPPPKEINCLGNAAIARLRHIQELTVVEVECGEIRGGHNSGGLTCLIEFCRKVTAKPPPKAINCSGNTAVARLRHMNKN